MRSVEEWYRKLVVVIPAYNEIKVDLLFYEVWHKVV
jgi:hypothetical protein